MKTVIIRRGDIYYADLRPVVGSEQGGVRPVLIIQNDVGNKHSPTVICAAITSKMNKAKLPTHVELDGSMTVREASRFVLKEASNSRFPVYGEDLDDIIGTVHIRDVLVHAENPGEAQTALRLVPGMLRSAHFIPETRNINSLFKEMQSQKIHMEIVIDEYGQTAGLVTMEDILEEIVGNILDEYDEDEQFIVRGTDGILTMSGMTPLEDAQEELGVTFPEENNAFFRKGVIFMS